MLLVLMLVVAWYKPARIKVNISTTGNAKTNVHCSTLNVLNNESRESVFSNNRWACSCCWLLHGIN